MKRTLVLFLALLMALSLCACGGGDTPPTKEEMLENAEALTIDRLVKDFRGNIVAAKDTYVGKTFVIPGIVKKIKEDGCILYYSKNTPPSAYFVKANIPVDELKNLNVGDMIHVVGTITDGVEKGESSTVLGSTSTHDYITMENAYFVDKITELSGTVHVSSGPVISHYIEVPFLTEDPARIELIPSYGYLSAFEEAVPEGSKVTISVSDIDSRTSGEYAVTWTPGSIKVEKAG